MKTEFEMSLIAAKKALQKLVDDNARSGVILDRGTPSESKIRNVDAIQAMDRILTYFTDRETRMWEYCPKCGEKYGE